MAINSQPSIRTLAKDLGISVCTVSKAIRNDPGVALKTRQRVQAEANRQGYRPNPTISRISGRRTKRGKAAKGEPLALLRNVSPGEKRPLRYGEIKLQGAREQAEKLGYSIEIYEPSDFNSVEAMDRIMYAKGIKGVILAAFFGDYPDGLPLKWERYVGVWMGQRWLPLKFPLVRTSYLRTIQDCILKLKQMGYCRVGALLTVDEQHMSQHFTQTATLLAYSVKALDGLYVSPPLLQKPGEWDDGKVLNYIEKEQPEVLILQDYSLYLRLLKSGFRFPEDMGAVLIYRPLGGVDENGRVVAGIGSASETIGVQAVNLIDARLRRAEYGLGDEFEFIVPHNFIEGETLKDLEK